MRKLLLYSYSVLVSAAAVAWLSRLPGIPASMFGQSGLMENLIHGAFILVPIAVFVTWLTSFFGSYEKSIPNILTVFATIFGVLSGLYALYISS